MKILSDRCSHFRPPPLSRFLWLELQPPSLSSGIQVVSALSSFDWPVNALQKYKLLYIQSIFCKSQSGQLICISEHILGHICMCRLYDLGTLVLRTLNPLQDNFFATEKKDSVKNSAKQKYSTCTKQLLL